MIRNFLITRQRLIVFSFSMPGQHSNYFFLNRWEKRRRAPDSRMERRLLKVCTSLTLFLGKKSRRCERSPKMPYLVQSQIGIEIELSNDKNADGRSCFGLVGSGLNHFQGRCSTHLTLPCNFSSSLIGMANGVCAHGRGTLPPPSLHSLQECQPPLQGMEPNPPLGLAQE